MGEGETINWLVILLSAIAGAVCGGVASYLIYLFTYKKELKKITFQGLNSSKQELYAKIRSELKEIKEAASLSNKPHKPIKVYSGTAFRSMDNVTNKANRLSASKDKLEEYLETLELIAPKNVIENTRTLIKSLILRNGTKSDSKDIVSLDKLDEEIKEKCDQLTSILREDLGAID